MRAQLETSMSDRIAITGDSHVQLGLLLQEARIGSTLYFWGLSSCGPRVGGSDCYLPFRKTLRRPVEAVVVLADTECLQA